MLSVISQAGFKIRMPGLQSVASQQKSEELLSPSSMLVLGQKLNTHKIINNVQVKEVNLIDPSSMVFIYIS